MPATPQQITRLAPNQLRITWSDGEARDYTAKELRERCPCATCREKHGPKPAPNPMQLTVLSADEAKPLTVVGMRPVGSYAYHVDFSDGHDTGIYTLELLKSLGATAP